MTFGRIPRLTIANRKRAAASNDIPAPKRHHPDAVSQLLETIKFQQQQIEKATNIWVRLKGGEDKLGDANTMFLGLVKSAMYSGSLAAQLVEAQEDDTVDFESYEDDLAEDEEDLDKRLHDLETSLETKQFGNFDIFRQDMEAIMGYEISEATEELLSTPKFSEIIRDAIRDAIAQELNVPDCDELVEMTKFVGAQMKLAKEAPQTAQDVLREHEAEIGL